MSLIIFGFLLRRLIACAFLSIETAIDMTCGQSEASDLVAGCSELHTELSVVLRAANRPISCLNLRSGDREPPFLTWRMVVAMNESLHQCLEQPVASHSEKDTMRET